MGWKTRIAVAFVAIAAWSLVVDAAFNNRWPRGTDPRWWALYVGWFGGSCVMWILVESPVRSRREHRER